MGGRLRSCIRRWSEMKRLTVSEIRGRCGEIARPCTRAKKREKECVDWGLDTVKLWYYQLGIGFSECLDRKTPTGGNEERGN